MDAAVRRCAGLCVGVGRGRQRRRRRDVSSPQRDAVESSSSRHDVGRRDVTRDVRLQRREHATRSTQQLCQSVCPLPSSSATRRKIYVNVSLREMYGNAGTFERFSAVHDDIEPPYLTRFNGLRQRRK